MTQRTGHPQARLAKKFACIKHKEDRIEIIIGDQNDDDFLKLLASKFEKTIDILLDDGSHITDHQIKTYNILYPCVNKTGLFIIEDLSNSYEEWGNNDINLRKVWPGMQYNKPEDSLKNYRTDFDMFINSMIKKLDLNKFYDKHDLASLHFYPMIVIFENWQFTPLNIQGRKMGQKIQLISFLINKNILHNTIYDSLP